MDPYIVEQGRDSISVRLIPLDNTFEFKGTSIPENADEFYSPIVEWIRNYAKEPNDKTMVDFNMEYFNTASSKMLLAILLEFEKMVEAGHDVKIFWHSAEASIDMKEAGEEYSNIVEVPFTFVEHS